MFALTPNQVRQTMIPTIPMPAPLAEAALVDARTAAAAGGMSENWWHERVREGQAPKPTVRMHRYTRWRVTDVIAFYRSLEQQSDGGTTVRIAARASQAALAKR
jgi:hypothetical protein